MKTPESGSWSASHTRETTCANRVLLMLAIFMRNLIWTYLMCTWATLRMGCRCPADTDQEESQPVQRPLVQSPLAGIIVEFPLEACPKLSPSGHIVSYSCLSSCSGKSCVTCAHWVRGGYSTSCRASGNNLRALVDVPTWGYSATENDTDRKKERALLSFLSLCVLSRFVVLA